MLAVEAYVTDGRFSSHIFFFVYTFWGLLNLDKKLNMTFYDFLNTQFGHRVTAELSR